MSASVAGAERGRERSPAIYGIRGLAAFALMTVHVAMFSGLLGTKAFGTPRPPSNAIGAFFVSGMPSFIGVFFVLPALFLYLPLAKAIIAGQPRPPQRNGFIRRLFRLLPAYYFLWLVVLVALNRDAIDGIWFVLRPFLLLQVYLPSPFVPKMINGMEITWTVPSMVQWYLLLPLIAWAVHRFAARGETPAARARRLMLPVPVLIFAGVAWLFFVKAHGWDNRIVFWWPQGFAPTIGIGMGLAIMLALAKVSPQDTPRLLRVAASRPGLFWVAAGVVYLVNCARPFSVIGMDAIYSTSGLLVTYVMVALFGLFASLPLVTPGARPVRPVDAVLTNPAVVHLGRVSYGIYLWHFAVMHFYLQPGAIFTGNVRPIRELYGQAGFLELELVTLAGSVLIATLSFYLLEQPIAAWADRRFRNRRHAAEPRVDVPGWTPGQGGVLSTEQAGAEVTAAVAQRDAIRANVVDLERSFGRQLLAGARLTGETHRRWEAATADLIALWEIFNAYSTVVDDATKAAEAGRSDAVTALLRGPSILLTGTPAPLGERHVADDGRQRFTVAEAVDRMNGLFQAVAALVTLVETVWNDATGRLGRIGAELAQARRRHSAPGQPVDPSITGAEAQLQRLYEAVNSDPVSLAAGGQLDAELAQLQQETARVAERAGEAAERPDENAA